jgi:hypothetical protein
MATVRNVHNEPARGCGFRKPGGIYLRTDNLGAPCGKLPLALGACPCCGAGIKPARGFTWVNLAAIAADAVCVLKAAGRCRPGCPMDGLADMKRAGLLWIGGVYYKTPEEWIDEAAFMGVSRRISRVPNGFEVGKTWVAVGHKDGMNKPCLECQGGLVKGFLGSEVCPTCNGKAQVTVSAVVHIFRPDRIEYVVKGTETEAELDKLEGRGFSLVRLTWDADKRKQKEEGKEGHVEDS